jgi:hypothetical protein
MKNLLAILLLFSFVAINAQKEEKKETKEERRQRYINEGNPFKKYGYTPRIATLSKGKYREFFVDTIIQIGSFEYNRVSKEITGFTLYNKENLSEADLQPELVSRWMSPDPLSDEFPSWSPYNFVYNNPVRYIDPTGLAPEDLILKGKNAQTAVDTMNSGLGGEYVSIDGKGKVSMNMTEKQIGNLSAEQKGLYDVINQTMDPSTLTEIHVKSGDHSIISGDFNSGKIDIGDINAFGTSDSVMTKYSVLGHEINEQFEYQQGNHKKYSAEGSSHTNSSKKEKTMNGGWERGKSNVIKDAPSTKNRVFRNNVERNPVYGKNATITTSFSKGGAIRTTTYKIVNGNIVPRK